MFDVEKITKWIQDFKKLKAINPDLTKKIMESLDLIGISELQMTLNNSNKRERDTAIGLVEENLPLLTAIDPKERMKGKQELMKIYYSIDMMSEDL
jgi:hypothetical protein